MRRTMLLISFCAAGVLILAPVASAQQGTACSELGDSGEQAQQEAQAILDQDPSDPNGLDADGDGIPCEFTESSGQISYEDGSVIYVTPAAPQQDTQSEDVKGSIPEPVTVGETTPVEQQPAPDSGETIGGRITDPVEETPVTELPDTGGLSGLTLLGGALLLGSGLVVRRIVK